MEFISIVLTIVKFAKGYDLSLLLRLSHWPIFAVASAFLFAKCWRTFDIMYVGQI